MTSRPGKGLHFFRTTLSLQELGIVVRSPSTRQIHGSWSSWREIADDDGPVEQLQGSLTGVKAVIAYPHVLPDATRCYVSVYTRATGTAGQNGGQEFSY